MTLWLVTRMLLTDFLVKLYVASFCFLVVLGFELRAFELARQAPYHLRASVLFLNFFLNNKKYFTNT
jgi:hypothetical protein